MASSDKLGRYKAKRNFDITSEPAEGGQENVEARSFVIQNIGRAVCTTTSASSSMGP
jgi:hypothetical protein